MHVAAVVISGLLALPAGWLAVALADRVPEDLKVLRPLPPVQLRGRGLRIHLVVLGLFLAAGQRFAEQPARLACYLLLFTCLVALSAIDLATFRLPDKIVVPLLAVSLPLIVVATFLDADASERLGLTTGAPIRFALLGGLFYFGFLLVAHLVFPRGMGFGDVKLAAVMGLYVGWLGYSVTSTLSIVLYAMLVGFVSGTIIGFVLLAVRGRGRYIPFGPFLAFGAIVAILFSEQLIPLTGLAR